MTMMLRRQIMVQPKATSTVLLHQYTYGDGPVAIGDYTGFVDEIGSYDLSTGNGDTTQIMGSSADTDANRAVWGIYPGDSFEIDFIGVTRANRYAQSNGIRFILASKKQDNTASMGRNAVFRIASIYQNATNANGATSVRLRHYGASGSSSAVNQDSTNSYYAVNGDPQTMRLTYDGTTGTCNLYVDSDLAVTFTDADNKASYHIDGLCVALGNLVTNKYWGFQQIKIYSGINS